jgi:hypothetical protein
MQLDASNTQAKNGQRTAEEDELAMSSSQKRFYSSEQCLMARKALQQLVDSPEYTTGSDYFSGNALGFVDRHLYYLSTHPTVQFEGYLSNLKIMTHKRI